MISPVNPYWRYHSIVASLLAVFRDMQRCQPGHEDRIWHLIPELRILLSEVCCSYKHDGFPGDVSSRVISSHGVDLVLTENILVSPPELVEGLIAPLRVYMSNRDEQMHTSHLMSALGSYYCEKHNFSHSEYKWCENHSLTHWGRDKMDAIFQMTVSNGFSWMKMYEFRLKFHWSLFPRVQLTIFQHWFR